MSCIKSCRSVLLKNFFVFRLHLPLVRSLGKSLFGFMCNLLYIIISELTPVLWSCLLEGNQSENQERCKAALMVWSLFCLMVYRLFVNQLEWQELYLFKVMYPLEWTRSRWMKHQGYLNLNCFESFSHITADCCNKNCGSKFVVCRGIFLKVHMLVWSEIRY